MLIIINRNKLRGILSQVYGFINFKNGVKPSVCLSSTDKSHLFTYYQMFVPYWIPTEASTFIKNFYPKVLDAMF